MSAITLTEALQCQNSSQMFNYGYSSSSVCEIEEEDSSQPDEANHHGPMATINEEHEGEDSVYVAVGKSDTSMEALSWTLKNLVSPSTIVYLIHVFPEIKHVPSPLGTGMIPKSQVSPEQVESFMAQERGKRRELLHRFLHSCSASKVEVDTILIESDFVANAILDLIPILHVKKLVLGTNKSNLRKLKSGKGNGIADQILQNAPENCKIRIICEGKEVNYEQMTPTPRFTANDAYISPNPKEDQQNNSVSCICFKPKFR